MTTVMSERIHDAVCILVERAKRAETAQDAAQFADAASSLCYMIESITRFKPYREED